MQRLSLPAALIGLGLAFAPLSTQSAAAPQTQQPPNYLETPAGKKPRVVITADPELDDLNSLIRYVLHASDYQTEGLIYASSQYHWTGDGTGKTQNIPSRQYNRNGRQLCPCASWRWDPKERFIDDVVDAYEKAYPNLRIHNREYPAPAELRAKIKWGNVQFEGEMDKDTDGSNLIKSLLLDDINEPIYLHAWGGQSTINRALKSIEEQYAATPQWPAIRAKVLSKAVIHPSGDQDDTGATYLKPNWPDIRYGSGGGATAALAYGAQTNAAPEDKVYYSAAWMQKNILSKGDLGRLQRVWGDGRRMVDGDIFDYFHLSGFTAEELWAQGFDVWTAPQAKGEFLGEGDTGTFLSLIDNGLEGWRQPNRRNPTRYATAASIQPRTPGAGPMPVGAPPHILALRGLSGTPAPTGRGGAAAAPRAPGRFLGALMNDLAGRLSWAVTPRYEGANHYPTVTVQRATVSAAAGEAVTLTAAVADPDKDAVVLKWWRFDGYGTYTGAVTLERTEGTTAVVRVPADAKAGDTIHIIAEATDDDPLPLTRYARTVITVR